MKIQFFDVDTNKLGKLLINSYFIFGNKGEFEKSENDNLRLLWGFSASISHRNNSRTTWSISAIHILLFITFKTLSYENNLYFVYSCPLMTFRMFKARYQFLDVNSSSRLVGLMATVYREKFHACLFHGFSFDCMHWFALHLKKSILTIRFLSGQPAQTYTDNKILYEAWYRRAAGGMTCVQSEIRPWQA